MLVKFIALMAVLTMALSVGIGAMVLGWGLYPKSWGWVIGLGIFGHTAIHALLRAVTDAIHEKD